MARIPVLDSPCPIKNNVRNFMRGDHCTMCNRQVFDLTHMDEQDRDIFFANCEGEVCISIKRPALKIAAASLAAAAMAVPMAAAAQEAAPAPELVAEEDYNEVEIMGGIKDPKNVTYKEEKADKAMAELPVEYEAEEEAAPTN